MEKLLDARLFNCAETSSIAPTAPPPLRHSTVQSEKVSPLAPTRFLVLKVSVSPTTNQVPAGETVNDTGLPVTGVRVSTLNPSPRPDEVPMPQDE
jgi:hypothetical protein